MINGKVIFIYDHNILQYIIIYCNIYGNTILLKFFPTLHKKNIFLK